MDLESVVEAAGRAIDLAGVAVIVVGASLVTCVFVYRRLRRDSAEATYRHYRQGLGRAILLGLEFLVAGDIIRTVAVSPTFAGVGVLALIVLIRTFLSLSLQMEVEGRLPWQPPAPAPLTRGPGEGR
ncbi:DUF1622 domain-containing protein [Rhizohabitans arisaemae]|uniref:DUF1622 domain-containing protein n=1 Tax=Rhizohabitans arisaemae TaxID=2720610 RepID=UPI0024B1EC08|nr:DUF1622 domain-containing protein [Rhizohabitans arisaemae]